MKCENGNDVRIHRWVGKIPSYIHWYLLVFQLLDLEAQEPVIVNGEGAE